MENHKGQKKIGMYTLGKIPKMVSWCIPTQKFPCNDLQFRFVKMLCYDILPLQIKSKFYIEVMKC